MKVNINTLSGHFNFGNKLQNYALQEVLKRMNYDVETTFYYSNNRIVEIIKNYIKYITNKRFVNFIKFDKKIKYSNNYAIKNKMYQKQVYDYYIVGSDQIWNVTLPSFTSLYLLENIPSNKRIAYAASFGIDELPQEYKELFSSELKKFKSISVRENSGKKIIDKIINNSDVEVVLDPTLLLSKDEWSKVEKKPKNCNCKKYILNYFLGELPETIKEEIQKIADENNCEIINILDKKDKYYNSGPSEFLWLEKNAFLICTDSYHASVFAFIYNRPFIVFDRIDKNKSMKSRISTLLTKLEIGNREYNGKEITKENLKHDYSHAYTILENEQKKSIIFLEKSLEGYNEK